MKKILSLVALLVTGLTSAWAENVEIAIGETLTDGTYYYATYSGSQALDFTDVDGLTAYIASSKEIGDGYESYKAFVTLTPVLKVPAGTGIVLRAEASKIYYIPEATAEMDDVSANIFSVIDGSTDISGLYEEGNWGKVTKAPAILANEEIQYYDNNFQQVTETILGFHPQNEAGTNSLAVGDVYLVLNATEIDDLSWNVPPVLTLKIENGGNTDNNDPIVNTPVTYDNIAALKLATQGGDAKVQLSNAQITYAGITHDDYFGDNEYVIIEDATGAFLLENAGLADYVETGDVLNGKLNLTVDATWAQYGIISFTGSSTTLTSNISISSGTISPLLITEDNMDDYTSDYDWRLVKFSGVTFNADDSSITLPVFGEFSIMDMFNAVTELPADGATVDFVGYLYYYPMLDGTYIQPVSITVKAPETVAATVGTAGYATFSSDKALDFTDSGIKAYVAAVDGNEITFTRVYKVPANTGVLLYAEGGAEEDIPVISEAPAVASAFVVAAAVMDDAALKAAGAYILADGSNGVGFYKAGDGASLAAGKAYLKAGSAGAPFLALSGATTGIKTIVAADAAAPVYNLNGQRVAKTAKGLHIIGGKKVILK
ncbi:MAG: hypothetical protein IJ637_01030 [Prevotella sp.]|nr:hypothetical protein [Prevotella sp.]